MSTYLNRPTPQPYAAGLRPDPDRFRNAAQYVAYRLPGESTWFGARVEPTFSAYDRAARDFVWSVVSARGETRYVRDGEAAAITAGEYERLARVELGVFWPAYKLKMARLQQRRREVWGQRAEWTDPPPREEMDAAALAYAHSRVRVGEGRPPRIPPDRVTKHDECDAVFWREVWALTGRYRHGSWASGAGMEDVMGGSVGSVGKTA
ncbi:hypothetical protein Q8F55_005983 [Vanrija albida]|uniref:Pyridoxamine 5'-phosphate oxidase Alr4036 family FMN-binding domain-containing protein n=1 Tax=Vanrija albida TaxID=181172 RepID=A0ABR3Q342_9TREE